jgi:hypothetical protein
LERGAAWVDRGSTLFRERGLSATAEFRI